MEYENLLSPIKIGSITLRNRIVMGAMGCGTANDNATISECECAYYAERAKGGCGLIITEVTRVNDENGAMQPRQTSAASDDKIPGLKKLADSVHYYDGKIFVQLHHPGRQGACQMNGNKPMLTPSGVKSLMMQQDCVAMTTEEVHTLINDYINAAERCYKAGIDGVELHGAHGYLLNQFFSPFTNKRTDEYGGTTENRARVAKEIIEGIRARLGRNYPVILRISADEFLRKSIFPIDEEGLLPEEAIEICKYLAPFGLDAVSVSAGLYETMNTAWEPTSYEEGWKLYLAEDMKKALDIPVFGVGVLRNPDFVEKAISEGRIDCAVIARGQLADPEWVNKVKNNRVDDIRRCISCLHCMDSMQTNGMIGEPFECAINARAAREWKYNDNYIVGNGRTVAVIGAGPAGCEAARVIAERGYKVVLFEKGAQIGGQLCLANKPPHKQKINWLIEWYENQLKKLGVEVRLNTIVTAEQIKELHPYAVFVGTGSESIVPKVIPGVDKKNVCTSTDILNGTVKCSGKNIAVIGSGMTGVETAELLAENENKITIIEMADMIGPGASWQSFSDVQERLNEYKVIYKPSHKLCEIVEDGIVVEKKDGIKEKIEVDQVVLSLGVKADNTLADQLSAQFERVFKIGDTQKTGRIANAVHSAFDAAYKLV